MVALGRAARVRARGWRLRRPARRLAAETRRQAHGLNDAGMVARRPADRVPGRSPRRGHLRRERRRLERPQPDSNAEAGRAPAGMAASVVRIAPPATAKRAAAVLLHFRIRSALLSGRV